MRWVVTSNDARLRRVVTSYGNGSFSIESPIACKWLVCFSNRCVTNKSNCPTRTQNNSLSIHDHVVDALLDVVSLDVIPNFLNLAKVNGDIFSTDNDDGGTSTHCCALSVSAS
mmetsp:Transcript_7318/g.23972  ORF Transcript_7318/g.23972 Transcript_7318/m.23972 type:complete len:113 (-) Transcript_7318:714-1052(-)